MSECKSAEAEIGGSNDGNAHSNIDTFADLGAGSLPFISKQERWKLSSTKFWVLCQGDHLQTPRQRGKVRTLLESSFEVINLLFRALMR
jgi:hypothetical protein